MKKFILFLFLAIAMATTAMAQFSFSNEKVYTLTTTRGWLIYNPNNEAFVASTASYTDFAVSVTSSNAETADIIFTTLARANSLERTATKVAVSLGSPPRQTAYRL